jgi:hypothetical protein
VEVQQNKGLSDLASLSLSRHQEESMDALVTLAAVGFGLGAGVGVARLVLDGVLRLTFGRSRT